MTQVKSRNNSLKFAGVLINVLKSCIGGGIYLYPELFRYYGYKLAISATIMSSIASIISVYIYLDVNTYYEKGNKISTLANNVFGSKIRYFADLVVILKSMTVAAGYLDLAKRILNNLSLNTRFEILNSKSNERSSALVILLCFIMSPGVLAQNISFLKKFSYLGTLSILIIIGLSIISTFKQNYSVPVTNELFNFFKRIGSFVFGFVCHPNVIDIHNDNEFTLSSMKYIVFLAFIFVFGLYTVFGYVNCNKALNAESLCDLFSLWMPGHITNTAILLFTFVLVTSVPNQLHPAKTYLMKSLGLNPNKDKMIGILMILICYAVTYSGNNIFEFMTRFVTTPLNLIMCFIFPSIFVLKLYPRLGFVHLLMISYLFIFSILCVLGIFLK